MGGSNSRNRFIDVAESEDAETILCEEFDWRMRFRGIVRTSNLVNHRHRQFIPAFPAARVATHGASTWASIKKSVGTSISDGHSSRSLGTLSGSSSPRVIIQTWELSGFVLPLTMKLRSLRNRQTTAAQIAAINSSLVTLLIAPMCCE